MNEQTSTLDLRALACWPKNVLMEAIDTAIPAEATA